MQFLGTKAVDRSLLLPFLVKVYTSTELLLEENGATFVEAGSRKQSCTRKNHGGSTGNRNVYDIVLNCNGKHLVPASLIWKKHSVRNSSAISVHYQKAKY